MKVPVFLAQTPTEMGITCLRMAMAAAGKHVGHHHLRLECGVSRSGTDLAALTQGAMQFGFDAEHVDVHALLSAPGPRGSQLPMIALWEPSAQMQFLAAFVRSEFSPRRILRSCKLKMIQPRDHSILSNRNTPS